MTDGTENVDVVVDPVADPQPQDPPKPADAPEPKRDHGAELRLKQDKERLQRERDEARAELAKAQKEAVDSAALKVEIVKMDTLSKLGVPLHLRQNIKATEPEAIEAEVEAWKAAFSTPSTAPAPAADPPPQPQPQPAPVKDPLADRPAPIRSDKPVDRSGSDPKGLLARAKEALATGEVQMPTFGE